MTCIAVAGELRESKHFEWEVANFFNLQAEKGSFYSSPSFVFKNISFHMNIYPKGYTNTISGFISLYLVNESDSPVDVSFGLHIQKADFALTADKFYNTETLNPSQEFGYEEFYNISDLLKDKSELVPSSILTIVCVMKFVKEDEKEVLIKVGDVKVLHQEETRSNLGYQRLLELDVLSENLRGLSTNEDSCDVVLKFEDKEFKAHRAILMVRSHVFAAMFQHDTLEKQTGIVKISDCDSDSFQEFLDYLYSGKLEDVSFRSAFHLYYTSNKYDVQELKKFCLENMKESLAIDNVCDIAVLADKYRETELMAKIQDFFIENWSKVFPTSEWESLMENNFRLANKLLVALSKTKGPQEFLSFQSISKIKNIWIFFLFLPYCIISNAIV